MRGERKGCMNREGEITVGNVRKKGTNKLWGLNRDLRGEGLPVVLVGDASARSEPCARNKVLLDTHELFPVFCAAR